MPTALRPVPVFFPLLRDRVERVDVLPFYQMCRFKWQKVKLEYTLNDAAPPSVEAVEQACAAFRSADLQAY